MKINEILSEGFWDSVKTGAAKQMGITLPRSKDAVASRIPIDPEQPSTPHPKLLPPSPKRLSLPPPPQTAVVPAVNPSQYPEKEINPRASSNKPAVTDIEDADFTEVPRKTTAPSLMLPGLDNAQAMGNAAVDQATQQLANTETPNEAAAKESGFNSVAEYAAALGKKIKSNNPAEAQEAIRDYQTFKANQKYDMAANKARMDLKNKQQPATDAIKPAPVKPTPPTELRASPEEEARYKQDLQKYYTDKYKS